MPANLTPEYKEAEQKFRAADSAEEKIKWLREMMSLVPKHKGTERLRVDLKQRLKKLEQKAQKEKASKGGAGSHPWDHVEREGAGQVVLVGLPNSGKSTLVDMLTNAEPEVAEYPYSTFEPTIGMAAYEDAQVQLLDLPPLSEFTEGWTFNLIRQADAVGLVVDLGSEDPVTDVEMIQEQLAEHKIRLVGPGHPDADGMGSPAVKKTLVIGTKADLDERREHFSALQNAFGEGLPMIAVTAPVEEGTDELRQALFDLLQVVRVYSKKPGQPASMETPYILKRGSTVIDAARAIHKEFAENLDFARIWGSAEYDGMRVERTHEIADGDVLEVHA